MDRKVVLATTVVVVAALALVGGLYLGRNAAPEVTPGKPDTAAAPPSPTPSAAAPVTVPPGWKTYTDKSFSFSLSYPPDWAVQRSPDEAVRLLATPNGRDSLLVRVIPLQVQLTEEGLAEVRKITDRLVTSQPGVKLVTQPQPLVLDELPGYYYFYRFADRAGGKTGVHAHYFLFDGENMVIIVFQALPQRSFPELASTFDTIAESFRAGDG